MLKKLIVNKIVNAMVNGDKIKKQKEHRREIKRKKKEIHKEFMHETLGITRYILSILFGQWVLFTFNKPKPIQPQIPIDETFVRPTQEELQTILNEIEVLKSQEKPYLKFYREERIANRYADRLKQKYKSVEITPAYDSNQNTIGYLLNGRERIV